LTPCCSDSSPSAGNLPIDVEEAEEKEERVLMVVADEALLLQNKI